MKNSLKFPVTAIFFLIGCSAVAILKPTNLLGQQSSNLNEGATQRDGQHDFDFNIGKWKTHITRLKNPLTGSTQWIKLEGIVTIRKVWDGRAQLEEIEADGPDGHWEGLDLFLYNPQSHQWSQTFVNSKAGAITPSLIGEFKNGHGEFFGPDVLSNGRVILVRGVWSDITPNTHKFEQAYSGDGGKTWEVGFIAKLEKME